MKSKSRDTIHHIHIRLDFCDLSLVAVTLQLFNQLFLYGSIKTFRKRNKQDLNNY